MRSLNFWLLLIALVCAVSFWGAKGWDLPKSFQARQTKVVSKAGWKADPGELQVHLRILNGTTTSGLAREFSLLVSGRGCVVEGVGNAEGMWPRTLLVNRRLVPERAQELAVQLGVSEVIRQWDERFSEDAVLILGDDFDQLKKSLSF